MREEKALLRRMIREQTCAMSQAELDASNVMIKEQLLNSAVYQKAKRLFLYYSTGREVDTHGILKDALRRDICVALPVTAPGGEMVFCRYTGTLRQGLYDIPEPDSEEELEPFPGDLMLVPGIAFDVQGYRLGRGGGYYDRYLSRYDIRKLGLCRQRFFLENIPKAWNDLPVDHVLTESGLFLR